MRRNVAPTTSLRNASVLNKGHLRTFLAGLLLVGLGTCGYWLLFTQFMVYDDEGYVLWSLHNYFQDGGLYTNVYSQYGPFLYAFYHAIHALFGITFDNETGRLLTLSYWLAATGLAGVFTWKQTRSTFATLTAIALTFGSLLVMINEPIHPGGLLAMLTAIGAVGGALALEKGNHRAFAILCGVCGAAMLLTKINVGAFFLISAASWFIIHWAKEKQARALLWFTAGGSILLPLWLMKKLWPEPWVAIFALGFTCAALALLLLVKEQHRPSIKPRTLLLLAGSTALTGLIILGSVWARGTSLAALWHGIVIAPLGQPIAYAHGVVWSAITPLTIVVMFGTALLAHSRKLSWINPAIALARLLVAAWIVKLTFTSIDSSLVFFSFKFGLPFAWLMAFPIGTRSPVLNSARLWLAWVFIWQTLHAYPVAGSQMGWGSFLWMPLAVTGIYEAIEYGAERLAKFRNVIKPIAGITAVITMLSVLWSLGYVSYQRFSIGEPLQLNGARALRLTDDITSVYRILNKNIRTHGDMLFSYPGLYSLNIWTERPTPTAHNVTHWFSLLEDSKQNAILEKLQAEDRAVIVVQSYLVNYLVHHGFPPRSELQRYIVDNFEPVFIIDTFQFWAKKGRPVAALSTASIERDHQSGEATLQLITDADGSAATVEIRGLFYPYNRVKALSATSELPWNITPLHADNSAAAETKSITSSVALEGINRIAIPLSWVNSLPELHILKVVIKDDSGNVLDSLQFAQ